MMRIISLLLVSIAVLPSLADEHSYGGIKFTCDVTVDGTYVPANTAVYAETWPTQMVVKPVLAEGEQFMWFTTPTPRTTYLDAVQSSTAGAFPTVRLPKMNGEILITPPYPAGTVATYTAQKPARTVYVDKNFEGGFEGATGAENAPYETIQDAVNSYASHKVMTLILVKPGVYDKGGSVEGSHNCRVGIPADYNLLIRSTDGAEVTTILGQSDNETYPELADAVKGCGPNAYRCVGFGYNAGGIASIQGFTLRGGRTAINGGTGAWTASDQGGGIVAQRLGWGISQHVASDCVITDCKAGYMGASAYDMWLQRCKVSGNTQNSGQNLLYGCYLVACELGSAAGSGKFMLHCTSNSGMPGFSYNSIAGAQRLGAVYTYWGTVSTANGKDGSPQGYTWATDYVVNLAGGDYRIVDGSKAHGRALLPERDSDAWYAWSDAYSSMCMGDVNGDRIQFRDGVPWSGALMETVKKQTVTIAEDANAKLTIEGAVNAYGSVTLLPGSEIRLYANVAGTRYASGVVVGGVTNYFADCENGVYTYTVPDDFDMSEPVEITTLLAKNDRWADAVNGSDSNKGLCPTNACRTLKKAMTVTSSGNTLWVFPGTYDEGVTDRAGNTTPANPKCRVNVKIGVTLASTDGPEKTIIKGEQGVGCVRWQSASSAANTVRVKGFTLTGGQTLNKTDDPGLADEYYYGSAVHSIWSNRDYAFVEDCIITNNAAGAGLAVSSDVTMKNCRFDDNTPQALTEKSVMIGCVVKKGEMSNMFGLLNSSFGTNTTIGLTGVAYNCVNCLILGSTAWHGNSMTFSNCVIRTGYARYQQYHCTVTNLEAIAVNDDFIPQKGSVVIDAADETLYGNDLSRFNGRDARGGQRVYNGRLDVGAVEYDWRGDYAADVNRKGEIAVSSASSAITEVAGKVRFVDGCELAGIWANAQGPEHAEIFVTVTGGTFRVFVNGEVAGTATAGSSILPIGLTRGDNTVRFVYEGDGSAEIGKARLATGMLIIFR